MSLLDALLLDPLRMNVWIAARTDNVAGTGTQNDPFDGSTAAKIDALMNAMPVPITSISYASGTATVTAINHPFATDSTVLIAGVSNSSLYNGTFTVTVLSANTFTYPISGGPPPSPAQGSNMSCRPSGYSGPVVPLPIVPPIAIHLGPGIFQTNGYADGVTSGWQPRPGMKIVGSGIDVTVLQLYPNSTNAHFYAIGHAVSPAGLPSLLDYFEISDLTIDSNLGNFTGTSVACGAVRICWRSRVKPLGDGDIKDRPENLCLNVVGDLPKCMDMISADEVVRRIEMYFNGGVISYLGPEFPSIPEHFLNGIASC